MIHSVLSITAIVVDLIQFFNGVSKYAAVDATAYAGVACVVIAFIFLAMDFYFFLWAFSVKMKLPEFAKGLVFYALLGCMAKLTKALDEKVGTAKKNQEEKIGNPSPGNPQNQPKPGA